LALGDSLPHPPLQVVKNKCAPPYRISEFDILFGSGINSLGCMLDAAEAVKIVQRKGSWYYYGETKLAQGRDKTLAELQANRQ
jgi:recombination protein RecA